jgi:Sm_like domain
MGEEFYAIIKLISGEEILSLVSIDENDGDPLIILQNPVIMKMIHSPTGSYIKVKPWMELSDDDIFIIRLDRVITMTETKDQKVIQVYDSYVNDEDDDSIELYKPSGQVKVSNKMGYVASVEDARKNLERIFKGIKES